LYIVLPLLRNTIVAPACCARSPMPSQRTMQLFTYSVEKAPAAAFA